MYIRSEKEGLLSPIDGTGYSKQRAPSAAGFNSICKLGAFWSGIRPWRADQRIILDSCDLPFRCTLETQDFVPPQEKV